MKNIALNSIYITSTAATTTEKACYISKHNIPHIFIIRNTLIRKFPIYIRKLM